MKIKTTKQFYKECQSKEKIGYPIPTDNKKWVAVDDLIEILNKLWCQGNTQMELFSNNKLNIIKEALVKDSNQEK